MQNFLESYDYILEVLPIFYHDWLQLLLVLYWFLLLLLFVLLFFRQCLWQRNDQLFILGLMSDQRLRSSQKAVIQFLLRYHLRTLLIFLLLKLAYVLQNLKFQLPGIFLLDSYCVKIRRNI